MSNIIDIELQLKLRNKNNENIIWLASVDIGSKNLSFYIEEINKKELENIKNVSKIDKYNADGTPTSKMNDILNKIYKNGKTILHKNVDITQNCKNGGKFLDTEMFHNMIEMLDKYAGYWDNCSVFVVEQQMAFKGKFNMIATKLGQHCQSYFYFKYGRFKKVIEFPAFHKTHILGAQKISGGKCKNGKIKWKNIDKPARKKWSISKATEIMKLRGDIEKDNIILHPKRRLKLDDLSDVVIQLAAFNYLCFVDQSI
jgi:hypothetical protein